MTVQALCKDLPVRFCPRCGASDLGPHGDKAVRCRACAFKYFHNNAAACGVVIEHAGEVLFVERGRDPAKGLLDVPGGFVDYGESLETAVLRETREEVGIALTHIDYLASFPNVYRYADVVYRTCDVYFRARLSERPETVAGDDAAACAWRRPGDVTDAELAFDSVRRLVAHLRCDG